MSSFYEPGNYGCFDIASTQRQVVPMVSTVPFVNPEIVFISNNRIIKKLTEGDGITVSVDRLSLFYEIFGGDFEQYNGVRAELSFFNVGVVQAIYSLKTIKAFITPAT